jgi:cell wall-associated NlpC family hydrolase
MSWSSEFVGIPFAWNGYDRSGAGCWGLVWLVQREVFGRELPRHDEFNEKVSDGLTPDASIWRSDIEYEAIPLSDAAAGDIVHLWGFHNGARHPLHVGVFVDSSHILHTEGKTGAVVVPGRDLLRRIIQVYRLV